MGNWTLHLKTTWATKPDFGFKNTDKQTFLNIQHILPILRQKTPRQTSQGSFLCLPSSTLQHLVSESQASSAWWSTGCKGMGPDLFRVQLWSPHFPSSNTRTPCSLSYYLHGIQSPVCFTECVVHTSHTQRPWEEHQTSRLAERWWWCAPLTPALGESEACGSLRVQGHPVLQS